MTTTGAAITPAGQKYATALLSLAVTLITALSAAAAGPWSLSVILGIVVVVAQGVVAYIVPLLDGAWQGGLKVGISLVLAAVTTVIPLLTGTAWTFSNTLVVILAVVNALTQQLGVAIRTSSTGAVTSASGGVQIQRMGLGDFPRAGEHLSTATSETDHPASQEPGKD